MTIFTEYNLIEATKGKEGIDFTKSLLDNFPLNEKPSIEEISTNYVREYFLSSDEFLGFDGASVNHPWGGIEEAKVWILSSLQYLEEEEIVRLFKKLNNWVSELEGNIVEMTDSDYQYSEYEEDYEKLNQLKQLLTFLNIYV